MDNNKKTLQNVVNKISNGVNKFFEPYSSRRIFWIAVGFILLLLAFKAGMAVGFKKASFSYRWGENYHRNFGGPKGGFFREFSDNDLTNAHGVFGEIIKIDGTTLIIKGADGVEKAVLAGADASIRRFSEAVKAEELKVGDRVVVIGEPNDSGQIEAKLIRIMPALPGPKRGEPAR